ncbi:MBL fold metallo-hydrolase [Brevibacillus migulae]|uniref:MBL fold metallo-hydrolase n=1 Tax=Brevibacillus migulae TaxID=1644114 RepID=UPI00106DFA0B|nr:MBL fold metallo-hydrolase [Brevibacillus migulae]
MKMQLVRHATLFIEYGGKRFLVDPMFSPAGSLPATINTPNQKENPLVELPVDSEQLLAVDAVIITHLHRDHLDEEALAQLSKEIPVIAQPVDQEKLKEHGFQAVHPVEEQMQWEGITIARTDGRHGTGEIGKAMGIVAGFVLRSELEPTLYIAGDTIWCEEVEIALATYQPDVTVVNAGAARFLQGDPITMTSEDVMQVCQHAPFTRVVAVHMEAWNHCLLTRAELKQAAEAEGLAGQVHIPQDGEWMSFDK